MMRPGLVGGRRRFVRLGLIDALHSFLLGAHQARPFNIPFQYSLGSRCFFTKYMLRRSFD